MLKIREWLQAKTYQFERLSFSANSVGTVKRIKDERFYGTGLQVRTKEFVGTIIGFDRDNINVLVEVEKIDVNLVKTKEIVKIEINSL